MQERTCWDFLASNQRLSLLQIRLEKEKGGGERERVESVDVVSRKKESVVINVSFLW